MCSVGKKKVIKVLKEEKFIRTFIVAGSYESGGGGGGSGKGGSSGGYKMQLIFIIFYSLP